VIPDSIKRLTQIFSSFVSGGDRWTKSEEYLDFDVKFHPAPGFAALERAGIQLFLNQPGSGGAGQRIAGAGNPEPGGWNRFQIQIDDLQKSYDDLRSRGASFRSDVIEGQGGKQALLKDPSGNLIELFEPKPADK
jgi:hypothetical protein